VPRLLIVRLGSLGDVIHAIPAVAALRAAHPSARIDWLIDPKYVDLLRLVEGIDTLVPLDTRSGVAALVRVIAGLRRARYDAVVDLQGLVKSAVLARAAGGRRTIGLPREHLREGLARFFYGETPDPGRDPHVVRKSLALMRALGVENARISFPLRVGDTKVSEAVVAGFGSGPFALINPCAAWPNKRWPTNRFGRLAERMYSRLGLRSLVLWGPGEQAVASEVVSASGGAARVSPPTAIADLCAIAKRAALMVSGDTGPLHLAAAVGTPVVALFGPTFPERNGPWSHADITVSRAKRCVCHYERQCRLSRSCIDDIGFDEVAAAVESRMATRG
jgi:lipopolysaccharide heptosyltransferase I